MRLAQLLLPALASLLLAHAGELHEAAQTCDQPRLKSLLAAQPNLLAKDEQGFTPLQRAIRARQPACIALLRQALFPNSPAASISGPQPGSLQHWVLRGETDAVKMMLSLGADPNAPGAGGTTPLADAALKGHLAIVRALLARGARPHTVSPTGTQPLHDAALSGHAAIITELVNHGADRNAPTALEKQTPLHIAALMGHADAVKTLLALGADRTSQDAKGRTPREAAQQASFPALAALLTP